MVKKRDRTEAQQLSLLPSESQGQNWQGVDRDEWIENTCAGFVTPSQANRQYYRLILEVLWPPEHGIPGPVVAMRQIREVIDAFRRATNPNRDSYGDPARRIRELQGEEGVVGIEKLGNGAGTKYQLVHLNLEPKRNPRTGLTDEVWARVLVKRGHRCAVCGRPATVMRLDQDHKIPRLRGGGDEEENWQPLCKECNNLKSTACRGCNLDCRHCPWAFPEKYAPIKMSSLNIQRVRNLALETGVSAEAILNKILDKYFENEV